MAYNRQRIEELAKKNPEIHASLMLHKVGNLTYEEMLVSLVVSMAGQLETTHRQLSCLVKLGQPNVEINMSAEDWKRLEVAGEINTINPDSRPMYGGKQDYYEED